MGINSRYLPSGRKTISFGQKQPPKKNFKTKTKNLNFVKTFFMSLMKKKYDTEMVANIPMVIYFFRFGIPSLYTVVFGQFSRPKICNFWPKNFCIQHNFPSISPYIGSAKSRNYKLVIFWCLFNFGPFFGLFLGTIVKNAWSFSNLLEKNKSPSIDIQVPLLRFPKMYIFGAPIDSTGPGMVSFKFVKSPSFERA